MAGRRTKSQQILDLKKVINDERLKQSVLRKEKQDAQEGIETLQKCTDAILFEVLKAYGKDGQISIAIPDVKNAGKITCDRDASTNTYIIKYRP